MTCPDCCDDGYLDASGPGTCLAGLDHADIRHVTVGGMTYPEVRCRRCMGDGNLDRCCTKCGDHVEDIGGELDERGECFFCRECRRCGSPRDGFPGDVCEVCDADEKAIAARERWMARMEMI